MRSREILHGTLYIGKLLILRVTGEMNTSLLAPFRAEELRSVVFCMHHTKAPGVDGMPAIFYQPLWPLVGTEVTNTWIVVSNNNLELDNFNHTVISLVPKCQTHKRVTK